MIYVVKFYLVGVMINLYGGVCNFDKVMFVLECMVEIGFLMCVYGEVIMLEVDIFDCEVVFIEIVLDLLCKCLFELKVMMEYVIIVDGINYICSVEKNFVGLIIMYYLIINWNVIFVGGIKLYYYCLLVVKCESYCVVLVEVVIFGDV